MVRREREREGERERGSRYAHYLLPIPLSSSPSTLRVLGRPGRLLVPCAVVQAEHWPAPHTR